VSGRFAASNKVAIVGYAHSQVRRRADRTLGVQAVETGRAAIEDAGLRLEQIDGFVSSSLLPSAG
jgi:acetyl-CoA acetyltransferase